MRKPNPELASRIKKTFVELLKEKDASSIGMRELAEKCGIEAIAYNAETPDRLGKRIRNEGREYLARVKMFIDLLQMFIWQDEGGAFIRLEK